VIKVNFVVFLLIVVVILFVYYTIRKSQNQNKNTSETQKQGVAKRANLPCIGPPRAWPAPQRYCRLEFPTRPHKSWPAGLRANPRFF